MSGTAHALKASSLKVHSSASKEVSKSHMTVEAQEHVDVCQDLSDILANYHRAAVDINFSSSGAPYPTYTRFCVVDYTCRAHITPQAQMPPRFVVAACLRVIHSNRPCGAFCSSTKPTHSVLGPMLTSAFPAYLCGPAKAAELDGAVRVRPTVARKMHLRARYVPLESYRIQSKVRPMTFSHSTRRLTCAHQGIVLIVIKTPARAVSPPHHIGREMAN